MSWADEYIKTDITHGDIRSWISYTDAKCKQFTDVMTGHGLDSKTGKFLSSNKENLPFEIGEHRFLRKFHDQLVETLYTFLYSHHESDGEEY